MFVLSFTFCCSDDVAFALKDSKELPWLAKYLWLKIWETKWRLYLFLAFFYFHQFFILTILRKHSDKPFLFSSLVFSPLFPPSPSFEFEKHCLWFEALLQFYLICDFYWDQLIAFYYFFSWLCGSILFFCVRCQELSSQHWLCISNEERLHIELVSQGLLLH